MGWLSEQGQAVAYHIMNRDVFNGNGHKHRLGGMDGRYGARIRTFR